MARSTEVVNTQTGEITDGGAPAAPFLKRVSDVIRDPSIWEHISRAEIEALVGEDFAILDAMFLPGNLGVNPSDYAIVLAASPADLSDQFTFACGGGVFVSKVKKLVADGELPILATLIQRKSSTYPTPYYDLR